MGYFKRMEEELAKKGEPFQVQTVLDEAKNMDLDLCQILTQQYKDKLSRVGVAFVQQQDKSDERFKNIETQIMLMKAPSQAEAPFRAIRFCETHQDTALVSTRRTRFLPEEHAVPPVDRVAGVDRAGVRGTCSDGDHRAEVGRLA